MVIDSPYDTRLSLLNKCRVWWEAGCNTQTTLLEPSDPQRPCIRIHPWYLGLKFPLSDILKVILICYIF
ncbi:unnamed protein product [Malus baccata var. baccata]